MLCANGCGEPARDRKPGIGCPAPIYCGDACRNESEAKYAIAYRARSDSRTRARERQARWHAANPEYHAKWLRENAEHVAESHAEYCAKNAEHIAKRKAKYNAEYEKTPKAKVAKRRGVILRRARKREARSEPYTLQGIWDRDKGICGLCHLPADPHNWHLDHIVPLGPGDDTPENVQVAHPSCNSKKGGGDDRRILAEWRALA